MARDVVDAAASYIGTPFSHQGRQPGLGLDCIGLVLCAFWACGYQPHEYTTYGRAPKPTTMRRELLQECRVLERGEPWQPADLLWFRIRAHPQHVAMWTGRDMIHAFSRVGKVVRQPLDSAWLGCLETVIRYRGVDE